MKYVSITALLDGKTLSLPQIKYKKSFNSQLGEDQWMAKIKIGKYTYIFRKLIYPPDSWMKHNFWPKNLYKRLQQQSEDSSNITDNSDIQGIRFDVCYENQTPYMSDDLGDQKSYKLVMDLMLNELRKIAKTGKNFWIINDTLNDSEKRDKLYDKAATRLSNEFDYEKFKFKLPGNREMFRFLVKK